jgi:hypothetical protein
MENMYVAKEVQGIEELNKAINNPPQGYKVRDWGSIWMGNNCYTIIYKRISVPFSVGPK